MKLTSVLLVTLTIFSVHSEAVKLKTSFRRIGKMATGLSFGHIHTKIDFKRLKTSHDELAGFITFSLASTHNNHVKTFLQIVQQQMNTILNQIHRVEFAFFGETVNRKKRQLGPIGFGLGIFNLGLSIYNTVEIGKLKNKIEDLKSGVELIAHTVQHNAETINQLIKSLSSMKMVMKQIISKIEENSEEHFTLFNLVKVSVILEGHISNVTSWGRGLEALLQGSLLPTLLDPEDFSETWNKLITEARIKGLQPLFGEASSIFKSKLSYWTTEDRNIFLVIHVPLVDLTPMDLFEHFPIPEEIGNLMISLEPEKNLIATDQFGNKGLELSSVDLLQCQSHKIHNGNVYTCPNRNLLQNDIKKTCLGSLFFGNQKNVLNQCRQIVRHKNDSFEFATQTGSNKFVMFVSKGKLIFETCSNGTQKKLHVNGIVTITAEPGCEIISDSFVFKPQTNIDIESDFLDQKFEFPLTNIFGNYSAPDFENAYKILNEDLPKAVDLKELKVWLVDSERKGFEKRTSWLNLFLGLFAVVISVAIVGYLIFSYISFRSKST